MITHKGKYERNRSSGMWRFTCSCGFIDLGTEEAVKTRAASHDLDWEEQPTGGQHGEADNR